MACIAVLPILAQPSFNWARRFGGTAENVGTAVTTDKTGNVYTTGMFRGVSDFDPGPSVYNLTAKGGVQSDIFISKLDDQGNFLWAKSIGSDANDYEYGYGITKDSEGNVLVTGYFLDTADFDPGPNTFNLIAQGYNIFILKLDSLGNFIWAKQFPQISTTNFFATGYSIVVDRYDNIYTTGYFHGAFDFDPGIGSASMNSNNGEIFISKLSKNGAFFWIKQIGSANSYATSNAICIDASNSIYITGKYTDTCDFDPGPSVYNLLDNGTGNIFVCKLDSSANFVWAKSMGGTGEDVGYDISLDASGNVYTVGSFVGLSDFDPGPSTYMLSAGPYWWDAFICKFDQNGNFSWAKRIGGKEGDASYSIKVLGNSIVTVGEFKDTADVDPGTSVYNLISPSFSDAFVLELDLNGNFKCAANVGGVQMDAAYSVAAKNSSYFFTGTFYSTADLDPGAGSYNLTASYRDAFLCNWESCSISTIIDEIVKQKINFFPNPCNGIIHFQNSGETCIKVKIFDLLGKGMIPEVTLRDEYLNVSELPAGIYIIELRKEQYVERQKLIIE